MKFISIVGTQLMAVINPVVSLKQAGYPIDSIILMATSYTEKTADRLKSFFQEQEVNVECQMISDSNSQDSEGRMPAYMVMEEILNNQGEAVFNLAGGMNFQVAACVSLQGHKIKYVYPENNGVHLFIFDNENNIKKELIPLPPAIDVLRLHGIKAKRIDKKVLLKTKEFIEKFNIDKREDLQLNVQIEDVIFDAVWNSGNVLSFLKILVEPKSQKWKPDRWLSEGRKILNIALQRVALKELHHREIIVLSSNPKIVERLQAEGQGKVMAFSLKLNKSDVVHELHKTLKGLQPGFVPGVPRTFETGNSSKNSDKALLTVLAKDIAPTLTALWTHKPGHAYILYTPGDDKINTMHQAMTAARHLLPCARVTFLPTDLAGMNILRIPEPVQKSVEVNISPGAKTHSAALALWSRIHDASCFSLENEKQQSVQLPHGSNKPLHTPDPATLLTLSGCRVKTFKAVNSYYKNKQNLLESMLIFLKELAKDSSKVALFPGSAVEVQGMKFKPHGEIKGMLTVSNKKYYWRLEGGAWIEELVGYVLHKCGATDVQVRIRTDWRPKTSEYLSKMHGNAHMTDIDVVSRFNSRYFVVSCKQSKKNTGAATREVKAMASLFGRFAHPLLFQLKYLGEPTNLSHDVYKFGIMTLTNQEALLDFLHLVYSSRSTRHSTA